MHRDRSIYRHMHSVLRVIFNGYSSVIVFDPDKERYMYVYMYGDGNDIGGEK